MCQADVLLGLQWSPKQVAGKIRVSHEALYLPIYANKANGGKLWKSLRYQTQKRKPYAGGQDCRRQIPNRRPLSYRSAHIEDRNRVGYWKGDAVIGANHKEAIVMVVERKSG
jgi:transposase, IS30 family